jgi:hypothetical protein
MGWIIFRKQDQIRPSNSSFANSTTLDVFSCRKWGEKYARDHATLSIIASHQTKEKKRKRDFTHFEGNNYVRRDL